MQIHMTAISKNISIFFDNYQVVYIHNLASAVNKYNNTYHNTVSTKPAGVKSRIYIDFNKENNKNNNLKLVIML